MTIFEKKKNAENRGCPNNATQKFMKKNLKELQTSIIHQIKANFQSYSLNYKSNKYMYTFGTLKTSGHQVRNKGHIVEGIIVWKKNHKKLKNKATDTYHISNQSLLNALFNEQKTINVNLLLRNFILGKIKKYLLLRKIIQNSI